MNYLWTKRCTRMSMLERRTSRFLIAGLALTLLGTGCTGDPEPIAASTTVSSLPGRSLNDTAAPVTAETVAAPTTTTVVVEDAPDSMAFTASRDLGRLFEIKEAAYSYVEPSANAESGVALTTGQTVRAARARLRTEGMWVEITAVAPGSESLGWVLDNTLTPSDGDVQLSNTVRKGTELETVAAPVEWLTILDSPAGDAEVGTLGVGEQLVDTGGWALLENGDVWLEVADASTGQVKGWVRSNAVREVVDEPEVQPSEDGGSSGGDGSAASVDPGSGSGVTTTTKFVPNGDS
jgi:hypothetical protein